MLLISSPQIKECTELTTVLDLPECSRIDRFGCEHAARSHLIIRRVSRLLFVEVAISELKLNSEGRQIKFLPTDTLELSVNRKETSFRLTAFCTYCARIHRITFRKSGLGKNGIAATTAWLPG